MSAKIELAGVYKVVTASGLYYQTNEFIKGTDLMQKLKDAGDDGIIVRAESWMLPELKMTMVIDNENEPEPYIIIQAKDFGGAYRQPEVVKEIQAYTKSFSGTVMIYNADND